MIAVDKLPDRFFLDLAIGVNTYEEVCALYEISEEDADELQHEPLFKHKVAVAEQEVTDDGRAFKARCKKLADGLLVHVSRMAQDPDTAPSVQLDAFKTLAKLGELEPVQKAGGNGPSGPVLHLTIVSPSGEKLTADVRPAIELEDFEDVTPVKVGQGRKGESSQPVAAARLEQPPLQHTRKRSVSGFFAA